MLEAVDLQLKYGSNIGALNFKLAPGTLTWLKGANGAGKSTLLLTLMGFETAREGRIIWKVTHNHLPMRNKNPILLLV